MSKMNSNIKLETIPAMLTKYHKVNDPIRYQTFTPHTMFTRRVDTAVWRNGQNNVRTRVRQGGRDPRTMPAAETGQRACPWPQALWPWTPQCHPRHHGIDGMSLCVLFHSDFFLNLSTVFPTLTEVIVSYQVIPSEGQITTCRQKIKLYFWVN